MNVLISQRHAVNNNGQWSDSLESDYLNCFARFGVTLFPVPNAPALVPEIVAAIRPAGIILSGGGDVSPDFVAGTKGTPPEPSLLRDKTEEALLDHALERRLPVLGICRGFQFLNVYFGGGLIRDLDALLPGVTHPCPGRHPVTLRHEGVAGALEKERIEVNSFHRQGVVESVLAAELRQFAVADHLGIVEGIYHPDHRLAAVQWHPERDGETAPVDRLLIESFRDGRIFWG